MARSNPNPRLAKIHRNYTVEEIAVLFGIHRNTVRQWIKIGLPTSDDKRPALVLGRDLAVFLEAKRKANKKPCQSGQIYCVRCREPKNPAGEMSEYQSLTATQGNLVGICPTCEALIYRRVSLAKLAQVRGNLNVTLPLALEHIDKRDRPSVNSDLK